MFNLSKFMERLEQAGNPIRISGLNIRKRGPDPDTYDVEMVVSAFDRSAAVEKPKPSAEATTSEAKP